MTRQITARERIEMLEEENRQLKDRIAELTGRHDAKAARKAFGLTEAEASIVMMLVTRGEAEYGQLQASIYTDRHLVELLDPDWAIRSHMKRIRRKMRPHGIDFETVYSMGYRMSDACRAAVRTIIGRGR
ncbi:helix-turn-helix domain-containing protein [Mesorhizobium sp. M2D.F.Ca.ET.232.01.1.1]|uniref:helix-turn-helix domain-containing protein n=1 Tax=Mesorhizobium sp. M2D.F.Ca.ET.232.01.1.1 TaxID=2496670 RepID=UPI000FC9BC9C|nr:helix-turn-helix domain-containing protein [Mesorhizobium sp. M2D.F.Ca.ET.232.01.1.1]TGP28230.1 helix-turn-helix domain-containing protein [Mesorhizobium sp. M2D.F.Ca.ET.232.01.1.1]